MSIPGVWDPTARRDVCVSLFEIEACSSQSYWWMRGFLIGNTPAPPDDEAEIDEWWRLRSVFLEKGDWREEYSQ
jgi:hypothetical protein